MEDTRNVSVRFVWSSAPNFERTPYVKFRLESEGTVVRSEKPELFDAIETGVFESVESGIELTLHAEVLDGPYLNSRALYVGASDAFVLGPDAPPEIVVTLESAAETNTSHDGPPTPDSTKVEVVRAVNGDDQTSTPYFRVEGSSGAVPPQATVLVFNARDVGAASTISEAVADDVGAFVVVLEEDPGTSVYLAVLADDRLSDATDAPGLQATFVRRARWVHIAEESTVHAVARARSRRDLMRFETESQPAGREEVSRADGTSLEISSFPTWRAPRSGTRAPAARLDHSVVYDAARGETILFGGALDDGTPQRDVWIRDEDRWLDVTSVVEGPGPRAEHGAVYDLARDRMLVFGGRRAGQVLGDLWVFSGVAWTEVRPEGLKPVPRFGHSMAYDPKTGHILLFGGQSAGEQPLGDTWIFDGTAWSEQTQGDGPSPRYDAALAFPDRASRLDALLYSGRVDQQVIRDMWRWTDDGWAEVPYARNGPPQRYAAGLAYDSAGEEFVLFSGDTAPDRPRSDVWTFDGTRWFERRSLSTTGPAPRSGHAMLYRPDLGRVVVLGGTSGLRETSHVDVWAIGPDGWQDRTPTLLPPPVARSNAGVAYDTERNQILIVGGSVRRARWTSSVSRWDHRGWHHGPALPQAWRNLLLAYDQRRARAVLVAGEAALTLELVDDEWIDMAATSSPQRVSAMAYNASSGSTILFDETGDTHLWNGAFWRFNDTSGGPPGPRRAVAIAYDEVVRRVVLFGGLAGTAVYGGTWQFLPPEWTALGPGPHVYAYSHAIGYDSSRKRMLLFGGVSGAAQEGGSVIDLSNSVWQRTEAGWRELNTFGLPPTPRGYMTLAYDPDAERFVLFGGRGPDELRFGDLWTLEVPAAQRPAITAAFDSASPHVATILRTEVRAVVGARGFEEGIGVDGAAVEAWDAYAGEWVGVASHDAHPDRPMAITASLPSRFTSSEGRIHVRVLPRSGAGLGANDARLSADSIVVTSILELTEEDTP